MIRVIIEVLNSVLLLLGRGGDMLLNNSRKISATTARSTGAVHFINRQDSDVGGHFDDDK